MCKSLRGANNENVGVQRRKPTEQSRYLPTTQLEKGNHIVAHNPFATSALRRAALTCTTRHNAVRIGSALILAGAIGSFGVASMASAGTPGPFIETGVFAGPAAIPGYSISHAAPPVTQLTISQSGFYDVTVTGNVNATRSGLVDCTVWGGSATNAKAQDYSLWNSSGKGWAPFALQMGATFAAGQNVYVDCWYGSGPNQPQSAPGSQVNDVVITAIEGQPTTVQTLGPSTL
jgi:hypothetical protein